MAAKRQVRYKTDQYGNSEFTPGDFRRTMSTSVLRVRAKQSRFWQAIEKYDEECVLRYVLMLPWGLERRLSEKYCAYEKKCARPQNSVRRTGST